MNARTVKLKTVAGFFGLVAALGMAASAHARDGLNWSVGISTPGAVVNVGNMPAVVVPAPVYVPAAVVVPARPVYVAAAPVVQGPVYLIQGRERKDHYKGKGWHKKHGRHAAGRSEFWGYEGGGVQGATVVQAAPHIWIR